MINPMRVIQWDGYSDIEKTEIKYDFMESTLEGFMKPEFQMDYSGQQSLKLDFIPPENLPYVSIITPTKNRRKLFLMALRNFLLFQYPKEKLEWIIIDDETKKEESIEEILPLNDPRIKYFQIESGKTVGCKRNIAIQQASHDYIIHMDDDDYYPPSSILFRIKLLLQYKDRGIECIGSSTVGIYDLFQNKSSIATDGILSLSEASMAYTKQFWRDQPFPNDHNLGEYKLFIQNRFQKIMDVPYAYIIIALYHKSNITGFNKRIDENHLIDKKTGKEMNFYDTWDIDTKEFINDLRKNLNKNDN
jgi:glycosyltransferase involved in cell wall biosynthesis